MRSITSSTNKFRLFKSVTKYGSGDSIVLPWLAGIATFFVCLILGAAVPIFPWWLVLGVVIGPMAIVFAFKWPFATLLLVLAMLFEVIPARFLPGIGSFRIYELLLIVVFGGVVFFSVWQRQSFISALGPFRLPIAYLIFCVSLSAAYVKFFAPNPNLLTELRGFVGWLLLPLLCYLTRTHQQRRILVGFIIFSGIIVAIYSMIQSFTGVNIISDRVEILDATNTDVTRSIAGGATYLMVFGLVWATTNFSPSKPSEALFILVLAMIAGGGIAVSFGRGVWIATVIGLLLASWLNRGVRGLIHSAIIGIVVLGIVIVGVGVFKPRMVEALTDRVLGVSTEIKYGGSFGWRATENAQAFSVLEKKPLTGVGLGGHYKQRVSSAGGFDNETRYIHNAYVGYMVKMGLHAVLFPVLMIAVFFAISRRVGQTIQIETRPLYATVAGTFIVPTITSYTQPEWIATQGVAVFCLMSALMVLLSRYSEDSALEKIK